MTKADLQKEAQDRFRYKGGVGVSMQGRFKRLPTTNMNPKHLRERAQRELDAHRKRDWSF